MPLERPTILIPAALVLAFAAAYHYRAHIYEFVGINTCDFTADMAITGLDGQPRRDKQAEFLKTLQEHFKSTDDIFATFSESDANIEVVGSIKSATKAAKSELSQKISAGLETAERPTPEAKAEAFIRKVFATIKPGHFAAYLNEDDDSIRKAALDTLTARFPDLVFAPGQKGAIATLPILSENTLASFRENPSASDSHLFIIHLLYEQDAAARIYLVPKEPVITNEQIVKSDIVEVSQPPLDQTFVIEQEYNDEGTAKIQKVTSENIGKHIIFAVDNEAISTPSITSPISGKAHLFMGANPVDRTGKNESKRLLLSVDSIKRMKESLRINLSNVKTTCDL